MNMRRSFTYPFDDPDWAAKIGLGALVLFVPILNFAVTGYMVEVIRRVWHAEDTPLPGWDEFGRKFVDGLLVWLAMLIYSLPLVVLLILSFAVVVFPSIVVSGGNHNGTSGSLPAAGVTALIIVAVVVLLYMILLSILSPAIYIQYAREGTFGACFNLRQIFGLIHRRSGAYFAAWALGIAANWAVGMITGFISIFIFWIPFVPMILGLASSVYVLLVKAHLYGQVAA